jgi:general secretion pathway protein L
LSVISAASLLDLFFAGIDDVEAGFARLGGVLRRRRRIELIEQADGSFFAAERSKSAANPAEGLSVRLEQDSFAGPRSAELRSLLARSRVDVVLASSHFVVRPLELPRGAGQFLDGVVRSQIDRLTPWSANEAAFGWSEPAELGRDRIAVTVAATSRALVDPIAQAVLASGADRVRVSARAAEAEAPIIPVFTQQYGDGEGRRRLRNGLIAGLVLAGLAFVMALGASVLGGRAFDARELELQSQFTERRAKLLNQPSSAAQKALQALEARKRTTPSAVITLEALSKTLPDYAHLTELNIEDGKVQIVGSASDAPSLIRLIEQSRQFTHATFSSPTVRGQTGAETFHIEAHIEPSFGATN